MKTSRLIFVIICWLLLSSGFSTVVQAQEKVDITVSVDYFNRYVWRGLDIANTPSLQPTLSLGFDGFETGIWGAYTLSNQQSESDEIDFWIGYTHEIENAISISAVITDYYFPNVGIDFFNFNNDDDELEDGTPDPGAHTLEAGLSLTGPESFPVTVSGYINFYNDAGNNTYFQIDYPVKINETDLNIFMGATGGSEDNSGYYGTDDLQVINVGVQASREIMVTESFSVPLNISFIVNPNAEISYLVAGFSF